MAWNPLMSSAVMALYDEYRATVDPERQVEIGKEIVRMSTENLDAGHGWSRTRWWSGTTS